MYRQICKYECKCNNHNDHTTLSLTYHYYKLRRLMFDILHIVCLNVMRDKVGEGKSIITRRT